MGIVNLEKYLLYRGIARQLGRGITPEILAFTFRRGNKIVGRLGDQRGQQIQRARVLQVLHAAKFDEGDVRTVCSVSLWPSEAWIEVDRLDAMDARRRAIVGEIPPAIRISFGMWSEAPRVNGEAYRWLIQALDEIATVDDSRSILVGREILQQALDEIAAKRAA